MEIYRFMELDTCPMCGAEIWVRNNRFIGKKLEHIPPGTVFEIVCAENNNPLTACGYFSIKRRNQKSMNNDWVAEYVIPSRNPNDT